MIDHIILYTNEFENKVKEVKDFYANKTEAQVDELINGANGFAVQANNYHQYYLAMQALINAVDNDDYYNGKLAAGTPTNRYVTYNSGTNSVTIDWNKLNFILVSPILH